MSEDGEATEIEAVTRVLLDADLWLRMRMDEMPLPPDAAHDIALNILDAIRSSGSAARNHEGMTERELEDAAQWHGDKRPQSEDHEETTERRRERAVRRYVQVRRSPQDKDYSQFDPMRPIPGHDLDYTKDEPFGDPWGGPDSHGNEPTVPSPQSEDHEADIAALVPFVHWQGGMRGTHNCDFAECRIEPCPQLRSLLSRVPVSGTEPDTAREREAYENGRRDRTRAIVASLDAEVTRQMGMNADRVASGVSRARSIVSGFSGPQEQPQEEK